MSRTSKSGRKPPRAKPAKLKSSRERVRAHRVRLRAQGLRLVQMWLPDQRSPAFRREALRQSRIINASRGEKEALDFIQAAADWSDR